MTADELIRHNRAKVRAYETFAANVRYMLYSTNGMFDGKRRIRRLEELTQQLNQALQRAETVF
jgi:hypothetical protein